MFRGAAPHFRRGVAEAIRPGEDPVSFRPPSHRLNRRRAAKTAVGKIGRRLEPEQVSQYKRCRAALPSLGQAHNPYDSYGR